MLNTDWQEEDLIAKVCSFESYQSSLIVDDYSDDATLTDLLGNVSLWIKQNQVVFQLKHLLRND